MLVGHEPVPIYMWVAYIYFTTVTLDIQNKSNNNIWHNWNNKLLLLYMNVHKLLSELLKFATNLLLNKKKYILLFTVFKLLEVKHK